MSRILNETITSGGSAQDVDLNTAYLGFIIYAEEEDMRVNIGANASSSVGEFLGSGKSSSFTRKRGETISVYGATTGKKFTVRGIE